MSIHVSPNVETQNSYTKTVRISRNFRTASYEYYSCMDHCHAIIALFMHKCLASMPLSLQDFAKENSNSVPYKIQNSFLSMY